MNVIKNTTARELYAEFPRLYRSHWGGKLWAAGYCVGSAAEHITPYPIKRYIEYHGAEDTGQGR